MLPVFHRPSIWSLLLDYCWLLCMSVERGHQHELRLVLWSLHVLVKLENNNNLCVSNYFSNPISFEVSILHWVFSLSGANFESRCNNKLSVEKEIIFFWKKSFLALISILTVLPLKTKQPTTKQKKYFDSKNIKYQSFLKIYCYDFFSNFY